MEHGALDETKGGTEPIAERVVTSILEQGDVSDATRRAEHSEQPTSTRYRAHRTGAENHQWRSDFQAPCALSDSGEEQTLLVTDLFEQHAAMFTVYGARTVCSLCLRQRRMYLLSSAWTALAS